GNEVRDRGRGAVGGVGGGRHDETGHGGDGRAELRRVVGWVGGGRGDELARGHDNGQRRSDGAVARGVGRHGRGAEIALALAIARAVGSGAREELDRVDGAGRAVERAGEVRAARAVGQGRGQHREVLEVVGAGVTVPRVVVVHAVSAQVDAERGVVV